MSAVDVTTAPVEIGSARSDWLRLEDVTRWYAGVQALTGATIGFRAGEVHGIIGPNGAGKSTLVKILTGADRPDRGEVRIDGDVVALSSPAVAQRHGLILMPQELALVADMSLAENIVLGSEPSRGGVLVGSRTRDRARRALELIDLDLDPETQVSTLTTVHKRLVMLARAVDHEARLIVLDEPTAGLAEHEAGQVMSTVRGLVARGVSVVYISHHLTEVAELCHRVTGVREGRVVQTLEGADVTKDALVSLILGSGTREVERDRPVGDLASPLDATGGLGLRRVTTERLRDVTFTAPSRSVTGLIGLLGSGVADVVRVLSGAAAPAAGAVVLDGRDLSLRTPADALRAGIAYLAGDRTQAAFPDFTVRSNVTISALDRLGGPLGWLSPARERVVGDDVLATLEVTADPRQQIAQLSGGNQQRALVGRLLAAEVGCLILDEPTVGVDIAAREALWSGVRALAHEHAVIVASSEPEELVALCDRVVCIKDGEVTRVLTGDDVSAVEITRAMT